MSTQTATEITLNGAPHVVDGGTTVAYLLEQMHLDPSQPKGIAVAVGDEVVPRGEWRRRTLQEGDRVEVITARQGG